MADDALPAPPARQQQQQQQLLLSTPVLAAVARVCGRDARLADLARVVSSFLDASLALSLAQAVASGSVALTTRVLARLTPVTHPLLLAHWRWLALRVAISEHRSLALTQLLYGAADFAIRAPVQALLELALPSGQLEIVQWLYEPALADLADSDAAETIAAWHGHVDVLRWLLDQRERIGRSPTSIMFEFPAQRYLQGVTEARWKIVELLASRGITLHASAVTFAAQHGRMEIVRLLVANTDVTLTATTTGVAAANGHFAIVDFLDAHGGVLPTDDAMDWALGGGRVEVLQWIHERYPSVRFSSFGVLSAASGGHADALQWLHDTFPDSEVWTQEDAMAARAISMAADKGHLKVVQWIDTHFHIAPASVLVVMAITFDYAEIVQYLHARGLAEWVGGEVDAAAQNARLGLLEWMTQHDLGGGSPEAMARAAITGHLDIVQWLHEHRKEGCTTQAMDYAAQIGRVDIVRWLHENRSEGCSRNAMDEAAADGFLDVVRFLNENRAEGCTSSAMDRAAIRGHVDVVRYLHEHRTEGCSKNAMTYAAGNGHLAVVRFLHEHRAEGCTDGAMDNAAANGHLDMLQFLHANRSEGCTPNAVELAAARGHFEVVQFLLEHYPSCFSSEAIERSASARHKELSLWLEEWSAAVAVA